MLRMFLALIVLVLLLRGPWMALSGVRYRHLLEDFHGALYDAGAAIAHGRSPYHVALIAHQYAVLRAGGMPPGSNGLATSYPALYPAPINVIMAPVGLLPFWLAGTLYSLMSSVALVTGLRLLGVRDWRCLAVALLSWPFLYGLCLGQVGDFLVLGAGVTWRWRRRLWPPAIAVASAVALKVFPWTIAAWLLITRRYRAFACSVGLCVAATALAWAAIGFADLAQYPRMLSQAAAVREGGGDGIATVLVVAGASPTVAGVTAVACALIILLTAFLQRSRPDGDRRAFGLAIIAALTGATIVWDHDMVLLFVPIALMSPRFSRLWLLPALVPVLAYLTQVVVPYAPQTAANSPEALRLAIPWLITQAVIGYRLVASGDLPHAPPSQAVREAGSRGISGLKG